MNDDKVVCTIQRFDNYREYRISRFPVFCTLLCTVNMIMLRTFLTKTVLGKLFMQANLRIYIIIDFVGKIIFHTTSFQRFNNVILTSERSIHVETMFKSDVMRLSTYYRESIIISLVSEYSKKYTKSVRRKNTFDLISVTGPL